MIISGSTALVLIHFAATWLMVGLIWFVQIVHYPLFNRAGAPGFVEYAREHQRLTTYVVVVPMIVELLTAAALAALRPRGLDAGLIWAGLALLAVIWASTAFLQVPQHQDLLRGFDDIVHGRLVATNWIRTAAWSARGILSLVMVMRLVGK